MSRSRVFSAEGIPFHSVEWGRTKVLAGLKPSPGGASSEDVEFKVTEYPPGYSHHGHVHPTQTEVIYVLSGHGVHEQQDGTKTPFGPGDVVFIPPGCYHGNHNPHGEPLRVLVIKVPPGHD